jgi:hypothetical protein
VDFTRETAHGILDRFGGFGDAVIRGIEIRPEDWSAWVELDAMDHSTDESTWCRVRIEFEGVEEWRFAQQHRSQMVVIFEAQAAESDGVMFVSFDNPGSSDPSPDDFRSTDAYIAARRVSVDVQPLG